MKPAVSAAAEELYAALEPFAALDEETDWTTLRVCDALVTGDLDLLHELVTETDTRAPWELLFDPAHCPASCLPYLGQYVGVPITAEMSEAEAREAIAEPSGFGRGTVKQIETVAKRFLTGSKTVIVTERYLGQAWRLLVETLEGETPNPAELEAAILREAKPIGIRLFLNKKVVWNWGEVRAVKATWLVVREQYATWLALRTGP